MNSLLKFFKGFLVFLVPFISLLLLVTIFYYFDILNQNTMKYMKFIILLLSCLLSGIYIGRKSISKGYLNGIKLSGFIILFLLVFNLFIGSFKVSLLLYYTIIMITSTLGSMIGIGLMKKD